MKIYLACALTHVPRTEFAEYVQFLHALAAYLESGSEGHSVKYALRHSDPQLAERPFSDRARLCYEWDCAMVAESDLVIAEASFPSIGLGIELQLATSRQIPIVICHRTAPVNRSPGVEYENPDHRKHQLQVGEGYVSLMALGLPTLRYVVPYSDLEGAVQDLQGLLMRGT